MKSKHAALVSELNETNARLLQDLAELNIKGSDLQQQLKVAQDERDKLAAQLKELEHKSKVYTSATVFSLRFTS